MASSSGGIKIGPSANCIYTGLLLAGHRKPIFRSRKKYRMLKFIGLEGILQIFIWVGKKKASSIRWNIHVFAKPLSNIHSATLMGRVVFKFIQFFKFILPIIHSFDTNSVQNQCFEIKDWNEESFVKITDYINKFFIFVSYLIYIFLILSLYLLSFRKERV